MKGCYTVEATYYDTTLLKAPLFSDHYLIYGSTQPEIPIISPLLHQ